MNETQLQHGAIPDSIDTRDYRFTDFVGKSAQFDWNKGFDIEDFIGFRLPIKNQYQSFSCGGQAISQYMGVLEYIASKTFEERSARFVYAQAFAPGGGANMRPLMKVVTEQGNAKESLVPSVQGNDAPESFMEQIADVTQDIRNDAMSAEAKSYAIVNPDIDEIALAIQNNYGCIIGVSGENNGTWHTAFPKSPVNRVWGHWLYCCGAKMIEGKKYIKVSESWGSDIGDHGFQYLGEDFFTKMLDGKPAVWYGWTIMFDNESLRNPIRLSIIEKIKGVIGLLTNLIKLKK